MKTAALLALLLAVPLRAQETAKTLLGRMTLEEKAGQLLVPWILAREQGSDAARRKLRALVEETKVGGYILSLGSAGEAHALIEEIQRRAQVPLLIAGDFEAGAGSHLTGTTRLGYPMLVGAAGLSRLARAMGRVTAEEALALGFHWDFAPVLDVNSNPENPIINVRAFSEDPSEVARLGVAFIEGMERAGMMATAKHFPGHGDVSVDSHLDLPLVPGDAKRLAEVELLPFRAAAASPLSAVMTAHIAVPGLGEAPSVPATLSSRVLQEVLRGELGFRGIIVTDALDMGGVRKYHTPGEAAVRSLLAGADVLLMSPDPKAAVAAVIAAVGSGRVPLPRLDEAVLRILAAKERMGLLAGKGRPGPDWKSVVGNASHRALSQEIAARGLTLVKDELDLVPLRPGRPVVLLTVLDKLAVPDKDEQDPGKAFEEELRAGGVALTVHRLHPGSTKEDVAAAVDAGVRAELLVAALHVRVRSYSGRIGIPTELTGVVAALARAKAAIAISFGNPYLARDFPSVSTCFCAFDPGAAPERAAAAALLGRAAVTGRLPITIPGIARCGEGLTLLPLRAAGDAPASTTRELPDCRPEDEGIDPALPAVLRGLLEEAIAARAFPGAVALVTRRGKVVAEVAAGRESYAAPPAGERRDAEGAEESRAVTTAAETRAGTPGVATEPRAVTPATIYDLASLTKVCATLPVVLSLVAEGKLALDAKVGELVPAFRGKGKESVTVRHLLTHTAGLPPFRKFFLTLQGKDAIVAASAREELEGEPGTKTVYSDLGAILLLACAEQAGGKTFEDLVQERVLRPLGMSARFARTGEPIAAAPTEDCPWRKRVVRGEVHDENAFVMGGVSGHAGLFGTARDVATLGNAFLGGGRGWLKGSLARAATRRANVVAGSSRALLFDTFVPGGPAGSLLSPRTFGHTGFTGTSLWCDPATDVCVVLLTNRVHPARENAKIQEVRRKVHDLVAGSVEGVVRAGRTVFREALLVDGSGGPPRSGSLAVVGEKIVAVGDVRAEPGDVEIDARGLVLAPGFIDAHAHDGPAPLARRPLEQGVTTVVLGNDGSSPLPGGNDTARTVGPRRSFLLGHGSVRRAAGLFAEPKPSADQLAAMVQTAERAARERFLGLSTGLEYEPGRFAGEAEIAALARPFATGGGLYVTHLRTEDEGKIAGAVEEAIRIGRSAGTAVHLSHLKVVYGRDPAAADEVLALMARARTAGTAVTGDVYPYVASATTIGLLFPDWALPPNDYESVKSARRDELLAHLRAVVERRGGPERILLTSSRFAGKDLAVAASEAKLAPVELLADVIGPKGASACFFSMFEPVMERFLLDPHVMIASDGGPGMRHPRAQGTFARVLARYVREKKLLTLQEAVRKMTSLPAVTFGFADRGLLAPGKLADLVLIDPNEIEDRATFLEPELPAKGIRRVFLGGREVVSPLR